MENPNTTAEDQNRARRAAKRTPEDMLEELHQLAGDVAAVFDFRNPEENRALESFEEVMDALENKVN